MQELFMMVGIPGSGKSLHASSHEIVHSSDAIREELWNDINDQTRNPDVFKELHQRVKRDLLAGCPDVVYDATNIDYRRRKNFLDNLKGFERNNGLEVRHICLFCCVPELVCRCNNHKRERSIPDSVIMRMYHDIDVPMYAEGWDEIRVIKTPGFENGDRTKLLTYLSQLEHDNPHHRLTVGQHCLLTMQCMIKHYADQKVPDRMLLAALLHDIGKADCKWIGEDGIAHYYGHEKVGAYNSLFYSPELSSDDALYMAILIRWHMYPFAIEKSENRTKTRKRLRNRIGQEAYDDVMLLHDCDVEAH